MGEQIIIDFNPDGTTKVDTRGFEGSSCQDAAKVFVDALGHMVSSELKPEYFVETTGATQQNYQYR